MTTGEDAEAERGQEACQCPQLVSGHTCDFSLEPVLVTVVLPQIYMWYYLQE